MSVVSIFIVLVFPAPFGPRKPKTSARPTSKLMLSTASLFPYLLVSWSTRITGSFEDKIITLFWATSRSGRLFFRLLYKKRPLPYFLPQRIHRAFFGQERYSSG